MPDAILSLPHGAAVIAGEVVTLSAASVSAIHRALASEANIRREYRWAAHEYLKYTVRGKRGAGRTKESILGVVRAMRRRHTESIERTRALREHLRRGR